MSEDDPVDPLPGIIAGLDQALAMAGEIARIHRHMFDNFRAKGFSDKQALYLAACVVNGGPKEPPS